MRSNACYHPTGRREDRATQECDLSARRSSIRHGTGRRCRPVFFCLSDIYGAVMKKRRSSSRAKSKSSALLGALKGKLRVKGDIFSTGLRWDANRRQAEK